MVAKELSPTKRTADCGAGIKSVFTLHNPLFIQPKASNCRVMVKFDNMKTGKNSIVPYEISMQLEAWLGRKCPIEEVAGEFTAS